MQQAVESNEQALNQSAWMSQMKNHSMQEFWKYFDSIAGALLQREISFRKTFQYLDTIAEPVTIVETGCVRDRNPWALTGEGHSTILFDRYVQARADGSHVFSVDINEKAVEVCRSLVSDAVNVHAGDSVPHLNKLSQLMAQYGRKINLLYLDSFDVDYEYWFPSASHHLKELLSAWRAVDRQTLVVVDDCPTTANLVGDGGDGYQFDKFFKPRVGGKGRLIAEYAEQTGAEMFFSHYQHGWIGFQ